MLEPTAQLEMDDGPFRGIVEQSLAGVYVVLDERFMCANDMFAAMFGYPPVPGARGPAGLRPAEHRGQPAARRLHAPQRRTGRGPGSGLRAVSHPGRETQAAAGTLSGGQQQMLAMARALMARPRLLLLDEPSMGLAPLLIEEIFRVVKTLRAQGMTILLVEQNAHAALSIADRGCVLETGGIGLSGPGHELLRNEQVKKAFLGM